MLTISVVFMVSFLPYLGLMIWRTIATEYEPNQFSSVELVAFQIALRSYFLSNVCNPIVYFVSQPDFKAFVLSTFCRCVYKNRKQREESSTMSVSTL